MPRETLPRQSPAQHRVQKGYVPIRRIAQACINCRRKKARCTGERPECSNCKRRDQECFYTAPRGHSLDEGIGSRPNEASSEQIGARLADIGDRITGIEDKLELLLDQHVDLSPSIEAPCSPEARYPSVDMGVDHTVWPFMPPKAEDTLQLPLSLDRQCILVDLYFTYCHNQPYSLFHENNFRERFNTGTLPHAVLLAVLANSSRFANHLKTTEASRQEAGGLADLAWHAIKGPCFSGTNTIDISILQALVLLCIFDFTEGSTRHSVAWVKVGIAVRLAQDLNFTDEPSPNLPVAEREEYRRAFWSLYLLERLVSCGKCRQPAILDRSCSPRLPCDEIAWLSGSEQQVATLVDFTSSSAVQNDDTNSFASVVVVASSLSHCAQYMLNTHHLGREHMPWHPQSGHAAIASEVLSLETRLAIDTPIENALKEQCSPDGFLDQSSSSTLVFSRLLFHLCQCLLYHPFLLSELVVMYNAQPPKAFWNHAKEISFHASRDMVDLLVRAKRAGCVLVSSFSGYCVTVAATVQGIHFTTSRSSEEHRFIEEHEQCVEHLEWLSRYWSNATSMESGLRDLRTMVFKYRSTDVQTSIHSRLEAQDRKLLWSLLDYSTLSKNIPDITRLRRVWNHNSPSMNEFLAL